MAIKIKNKKTIFIVVENSLSLGVEAYAFANQKKAQQTYSDILSKWKEELVTLGKQSRIEDDYSILYDSFNEEVVHVLWKETSIE